MVLNVVHVGLVKKNFIRCLSVSIIRVNHGWFHFRLFLQELGFQAGQHEIVAETLNNQLQQEIIKKSKEISKKTKINIKEAKKISENLNRSYKDLEKIKSKYQKSHNEMEEAKSTFHKADCEGTMSRNEISKLKHARKVFIMSIYAFHCCKMWLKKHPDFKCFILLWSITQKKIEFECRKY